MLTQRGIMRNLPFMALSFSFLACATDSTVTPAPDELGGENGQDGEIAKADGRDNFGFIAVHKSGAFDCHNPLTCINYKLDRPNRSTIQCNDGQYHDSCAVHAIAWTSAGLAQDKIDQIEAAITREAHDPTIGTQ